LEARVISRWPSGLRFARSQQIVSDDDAGLKAAREARFAGVPWQRCQLHLQQNARHYVPRMRSEVAADLRAIFDAPDRQEADRRLKLAIQKYENTAPKLASGNYGGVFFQAGPRYGSGPPERVRLTLNR
jgi:transposase-like protein